jgi:hypothetical protein
LIVNIPETSLDSSNTKYNKVILEYRSEKAVPDQGLMQLRGQKIDVTGV